MKKVRIKSPCHVHALDLHRTLPVRAGQEFRWVDPRALPHEFEEGYNYFELGRERYFVSKTLSEVVP